ncbi:MAG: hypothetical protein ACFFDN_17635 [Candidatus Hodarchaeota archaeon]
MVIVRQQNGLYFALEPHEFKQCNWRKFFDEIKRLDGWEYDGENKQWYIPESAIQAFNALRTEYIDNIIHKDQMSMF